MKNEKKKARTKLQTQANAGKRKQTQKIGKRRQTQANAGKRKLKMILSANFH